MWRDDDTDGIYDAGTEVGLAGVVVTLYTSGGAFVGTSITDSNGFYEFPSLTPGSYYLAFEDPTTLPDADEFWTYTFQDVGANDNIDSDAENTAGPNYGHTATFTLSAGETRTNIMAGYIPSGMLRPIEDR